MVAQIASFGRVKLMQGVLGRAVSPVAVAPRPTDRPPQPDVRISASTVALAPAAMTALIEAQERLSENAPLPVRQHTAQKIDHLIWRLDGSDAGAAAPFAVRQLETAREALSLSRVDLQA